MVEVIDPITNIIWNYHIDKRLKRFLDEKVKDLISKKDKDYVMLVDGYEGSGKSTFGQQIGKYVDPTLNLSRICMTANEFKEAIIKAEKNQCVIYDEAVTGMTAGDSITRIGKLLKSMMMQMRQKNLFVIVILPTIFELNKYSVLSRARSFFHIYESGGRMGYWVGYNRKDTRNIYIKGRKTYSYRVKSFFNGRFYGKYTVDEEEYRKKKADVLFKLDNVEEEIEKGSNWMKKQRNLGLKLLHDRGLTYKEISDLYKKAGCVISVARIAECIGKSSELAENR